jgi:squalene cyclase
MNNVLTSRTSNKTQLKIIVGVSLVLLTIVLPAHAQQAAIDNGLTYLRATQNPDGSWGGNTDLAVLDTSTVLDTLKLLNINDPAYSNGVIWLRSQSPTSNDFLSRKVTTLFMAGDDVSSDLSILVDRRNTNGGWGPDADSTSIVIDTVLALEALHATNYADSTVISKALSHLLSLQNTDGGFGFYGGDVSHISTTALCLLVLKDFQTTFGLSAFIAAGTNFLISQQNVYGLPLL